MIVVAGFTGHERLYKGNGLCHACYYTMYIYIHDLILILRLVL